MNLIRKKKVDALGGDGVFRPFSDLTGQKFGRFTAISYRAPSSWICMCDCRTFAVVSTGHLMSGHTRSCGCRKRQMHRERLTTHGKSHRSEYRIWQKMIRRCSDPTDKTWHNYGGRGIAVCEEWKHSFPAFFNAMGPRPSLRHSVDRFPNNDGNYEPGNVRWATPLQQACNMRVNKFLELDGRRMVMAEWARELGFARSTSIKLRLEQGWSLRDALTIPSRTKKVD